MSSTNLVNDKCCWSGTCGKEDHPQKTHFGFLWQSYKSFFVFAYLLCYALPNSYALLQIVFPSYTIVMTCQIGMPCLIVMPCQIVMICQIVMPGHIGKPSYQIVMPCQIIMPCQIVMPCQIGMPSYQIVMPCQIVCLQKQNQLAFHCCNKK